MDLPFNGSEMATTEFPDSRSTARRRIFTLFNLRLPGGYADVIDNIARLGHYARDRLLQVGGANMWSLSVLIETWDGSALLINRGGEARSTLYSSRRFTTEQQCLREVPRAFMEMLEAMTQSGTMVDLIDLKLVFRYDRAPEANGRMKKYILDSIASNENREGLFKYTSSHKLCGYQAVIMAMVTNKGLRERWTGDLTWFTQEFNEGEPSVKQLKKKRFIRLAEHLRHLYGGGTDGWNMNHDDQGTISRIVAVQQRWQIVILNEVTTLPYMVKRGALFQPSEAKHSTIVMSYTLEHLHLIKSPWKYLGRKSFNAQNRYEYCYNCLAIKARGRHICDNTVLVSQCPKCCVFFENEEHRKKHCMDKEVTCARCERYFYNEHCMAAHRCRERHVVLCDMCGKRKYDGHECGRYICLTCNKKVNSTHRCSMDRLPPPKKKTAAEWGEHYYAFDLESMFIREANGKDRHVVNYIVVCRCFSDEEYSFSNMEDFIQWIHGLQEPVTLYAHNLKGYDGRMVFDYLMDKHMIPQNVMWRGSKIMQMDYGKVTFKDTLLHLPASLAQLPKMFGLDERQFKKGFFPYKFNTPENQTYGGEVVPAHYFNPDQMSTGKREEFYEWYAERRATPYYFQQELREYCLSDTRILARSIEAYMGEQMKVHAFNPLDRMTIASYAMAIYRTYYLPENAIYGMSPNEESRIRKAMHGGRTDTRRMLKEWSEEEVNQGIYGKYQDVQSLYPTVQFYDPLPVGLPSWNEFTDDNQPQDLMNVFGFVCCDIEPTRYLHHPILVDLNEKGRLVADLLPKTQKVIATPELHLALQNGYKVTKVYWLYSYKSSTELFKNYFRQFVKAKLQASGVPKWVRTDADWEEYRKYHSEELGIELRREDMVANAAKKTGAKLLCNSLWGKFGENSEHSTWKRFMIEEQSEAIMAIENQWIDGEIDIMYRKYSKDNVALAMIYKYNAALPLDSFTQKKRRCQKNIAMAAMITSHARCRLWKELNKLGERVLYHDTDSIIYEHRPGEYNIPVGKYLGEWECETGGKPIVKFVSTGPKCYSYVVDNGDGTMKSDTKVKGITLHHNNSQLINFDAMKALVTGEEEQILTQCVSFQYDQRNGTMVTSDVCKIFKQTYEKGDIMADYMVRPFGWQKFLL